MMLKLSLPMQHPKQQNVSLKTNISSLFQNKLDTKINIIGIYIGHAYTQGVVFSCAIDPIGWPAASQLQIAFLCVKCSGIESKGYTCIGSRFLSTLM